MIALRLAYRDPKLGRRHRPHQCAQFAQKMFAARIKAKVTEVNGSHASLVVHAQEVAEVIEKAALAK